MRATSSGIAVGLLLFVVACGGGNTGGIAASVDPSSGPPGTEIAYSVSGCTTGPSAELYQAPVDGYREDAADGEVAIRKVASDETGRGTLVVPDAASAGEYTVAVTCVVETELEGEKVVIFANDQASFEVTG